MTNGVSIQDGRMAHEQTESKQWIHCVMPEMGTLGSSRDSTVHSSLLHIESDCLS